VSDLTLDSLSQPELVSVCRKSIDYTEVLKKENQHLKEKNQDLYDALMEIRTWTLPKEDGTFLRNPNTLLSAIQIRSEREIAQVGVVMFRHFKELELLWKVARKCGDIIDPKTTQIEVYESVGALRDLLETLLHTNQKPTIRGVKR